MPQKSANNQSVTKRAANKIARRLRHAWDDFSGQEHYEDRLFSAPIYPTSLSLSVAPKTIAAIINDIGAGVAPRNYFSFHTRSWIYTSPEIKANRSTICRIYSAIAYPFPGDHPFKMAMTELQLSESSHPFLMEALSQLLFSDPLIKSEETGQETPNLTAEHASDVLISKFLKHHPGKIDIAGLQLLCECVGVKNVMGRIPDTFQRHVEVAADLCSRKGDSSNWHARCLINLVREKAAPWELPEDVREAVARAELVEGFEGTGHYRFYQSLFRDADAWEKSIRPLLANIDALSPLDIFRSPFSEVMEMFKRIVDPLLQNKSIATKYDVKPVIRTQVKKLEFYVPKYVFTLLNKHHAQYQETALAVVPPGSNYTVGKLLVEAALAWPELSLNQRKRKMTIINNAFNKAYALPEEIVPKDIVNNVVYFSYAEEENKEPRKHIKGGHHNPGNFETAVNENILAGDFLHALDVMVHEKTHRGQVIISRKYQNGTLPESHPLFEVAPVFALCDIARLYIMPEENFEGYTAQIKETDARLQAGKVTREIQEQAATQAALRAARTSMQAASQKISMQATSQKLLAGAAIARQRTAQRVN